MSWEVRPPNQVCCWSPLIANRTNRTSEVGGKRVCKDRAPQPGGRFVPSVRAARSVIHVESGIKWGGSPLPFSLLGLGVLHFPFPFRIGQLELV